MATAERMDEIGADKTTTAWIWQGVEEDPARVAEMQPPWPIPPTVAIKADVGHHWRAPDVIEQSVASVKAGACAVHLHIRDDAGRDTGDIGLWREVTQAIKAEVGDVPIDSGLRGSTWRERMSHLEEGLFDIVPIIPTWKSEYLGPACREMESRGIRPEICVWDPTDVGLAKSQLIDAGAVTRPGAWLIVPSSPYYGTPMPNPFLMARGLMTTVELILDADPEALITVCASGRASSYLATQGLLLGLHMRPGIGETHWRHPHVELDGGTAPMLIEDAASVARALGRAPATADEYRQMISLP